MSKLRELSYQEVTKRLRKLGFRFHRQGKGSHTHFLSVTNFTN